MEDDEIDDWLDSDSDGAGEEQQAAPAPAASSSTTGTATPDAGDGTTPSEATTPERANPAPTTAAPSSPDHEAPPANPASPPRVEATPDAPVVAVEVSTDATPAKAPPPRDDADHDRATTPPEPPAPSPVATRVEPESAPADEMQTLSLSPGASPVALNAPRAPFDAPAVRLDATRLDLNSAPEPEEPEHETELDEPAPDASPSPSPWPSPSASTAPTPPAAPTAHAPPPVVSAMTAEPTPPRADATRPVSDPDRDADPDPNQNQNPNPAPDLDLDLDDAPAGLGVLGGWALGGFGAATRLARDSLRAVASSDLADKTARAARGIRREIVDLSKHVAGDDLAVASSNPAGDARFADESGPSPEPEPETAQSLWRAFGHLARDTARAFESAATAAATNPDVAVAAEASARVVSGFARRVEEGAFRLLRVHGADEDAAAEDASALERALVACGCASTLDELERLDAETARGGAEAADVHVSSAEAAANAAEAERLLDLEDPDADDGGDDRAGGAPCPGEDALELTRAMREEAIVAARESAAAAVADAESRAAISSPEHSDATALEASIAPIRAEAATRVAEMVAAIVAHLLDVAASLGPSPSSSAPWPPPTSTEITARDVARARARAVRRRVAAALDDAEAVVDAYAEARVAVADAAASAGATDAAAASRVKEDAARGADAAKATARGYASDAARCLASIVAATAATAVAAKGGGVAATVAVQE